MNWATQNFLIDNQDWKDFLKILSSYDYNFPIEK